MQLKKKIAHPSKVALVTNKNENIEFKFELICDVFTDARMSRVEHF
jgi:hypothetical protein